MARIRTIKPEFFTDEDLGSLPPSIRLLFIAMWTEADKAGRLKDKPKTLKARCLPFDSIDIEKALCQLEQSKFIIRYTVDGERYIQIRTWDEHQRPHHTERESTHPAAVEGDLMECAPLSNGDLTVISPLEHGEKKDARKREPSLPFLSLPFPSCIEEGFRGMWESWLKHRNQIKKPLTEEQAKRQLTQFSEWGEDRACAAIEYTIRQGWQGLREPEGSNQTRASPTAKPTVKDLLNRAFPKDNPNGDGS